MHNNPRTHPPTYIDEQNRQLLGSVYRECLCVKRPCRGVTDFDFFEMRSHEITRPMTVCCAASNIRCRVSAGLVASVRSVCGTVRGACKHSDVDKQQCVITRHRFKQGTPSAGANSAQNTPPLPTPQVGDRRYSTRHSGCKPLTMRSKYIQKLVNADKVTARLEKMAIQMAGCQHIC